MSSERGEIGLPQLLMAMAIMLGVLGATLTVFTSSERLNADANSRNEAQDRARVALDDLAAQLRNLASPSAAQPQAIDQAGAFDVVFQTVDSVGPNAGLNSANLMRMRYCLGGSASSGVLYRQSQRWTSQDPPSMPSTTGCPSSDVGWQETRVMAEAVTNRRDGLERPLFTFNAATPADISQIHAQVHVDLDVARPPAETTISSGVFLRNQNRRPVAAFTADTSVPSKIILNGALSADPEGDPLQYVWFDGAAKIGEGIRYDHTVEPGSSHDIRLKVFDLAGLDGVSAPQTVVTP